MKVLRTTPTVSINLAKSTAIKFVILLGIVSLFSDMTYEGARSITGPYLATLGASAAVVGFVAGCGELMGYGLRLISGHLADRSQQYWTITIIGYLTNLLAVPLLALADHWWMAATLMMIERMGKAIRTPARDAMLSHAGQQIGLGWGFGLHEALDQTGAMLGPLMVAAVLYVKGSYHQSFVLLLIPALLALTTLVVARWLYPRPQHLEPKSIVLETKGIHTTFWLYLGGASLIAAGYTDFPLMAYHFEKLSLIPKIWIPVAYAIAMGANAFTAPLLGYFYDRKGFVILLSVTMITCFFAPFVFLSHSMSLLLLGVVLWGIGMGAHESLMRAIVATMVPSQRRASAYGIFNLGYGIFWFLGSVLMGLLYDVTPMGLVIFSIIIQLAALPIFMKVMKNCNPLHTAE